ncbi:MAG: hypothetical protein WD276_10140 [Actinomycetota bacterium]
MSETMPGDMTAPQTAGPGMFDPAAFTAAAGYIGTALAITGYAAAVGSMEDLGSNGQLVAVAVITVLLFVAGWIAGGSDREDIARLGSVQWLLSTFGVGVFLVLLSTVVLEMEGDGPTILTAAGITVYSGALWMMRRRCLQQVALFVSLASLVGAIGNLLPFTSSEGEFGNEPAFPSVGILVWALGVVWIVLARRGTISPERTGYALGSIAALFAPLSFDPHRWLGYVIGVATLLWLIWLAAQLRMPVVTGFVALGALTYPGAITAEYVQDSLPGGVILAVIGALIVVAVLMVSRPRAAVTGTAGPETGTPGMG